MKKIMLTLLMAVTLSSGMANAIYVERNLLLPQANPDYLKTVLVQQQKWVPFPAYSDRAGWDRLLGDWKQQYIEKGEKYLDYEWKAVPATDYMIHDRGGSQGAAMEHFGANLAALESLMFAELAEGKGRFIDQLMNGAYSTCEVSSWVLSHHLYIQKSKHYFPVMGDKAIDLVAGDVGSMMAWVYYFFHDAFDKVESQVSPRIKHELQTRIMEPYMTCDYFWWVGDNFDPAKDRLNNWTPWCNVNVLQVFALVEDDLDVFAKATARTMKSVNIYLNNLGEDGACDEGPSYWSQGPAKNFEYLFFLKMITGGGVNLFDNPMIKSMGEYIARSYIGNGWVVNFADASARGGGSPISIYAYGKETGSDLMKGYAAYLLDGEAPKAVGGRYVIRTFISMLVKDELVKQTPVLPAAKYSWYPDTQFCYMNDDNGLFLGSKAGHNDESHNHNDVGTFVLFYKTIPFIIDAGVGTYITKTFSSQRYEIWTMQSAYHNLPLVNGVMQKEGKKYKSTAVSFNPAKMTMSLDMAGAYPENAKINSWVRSYTLKDGKFTIKDNYSLKESLTPTTFNFLTWGDVDINTPGKVSITVQGENLVLNYDGRSLEPSIETIELDDPPLVNVWGKKIYRVSLTEKKASVKGTRIFTVEK